MRHPSDQATCTAEHVATKHDIWNFHDQTHAMPIYLNLQYPEKVSKMFPQICSSTDLRPESSLITTSSDAPTYDNFSDVAGGIDRAGS